MSTIADVQVLSANGTESFAIGVVQRIDWNFEQGIFTQEGSKVNVLCELRAKWIWEFPQASHAFQLGVSGKFSLHYETLGSATDIYFADKILQLKIFEFDFVKFKRDFVAIADLFMNNEADIDSEWFSWIRHRIFPSVEWPVLPHDLLSKSNCGRNGTYRDHRYLDFSIYNKLRQILEGFSFRRNGRFA